MFKFSSYTVSLLLYSPASLSASPCVSTEPHLQVGVSLVVSQNLCCSFKELVQKLSILVASFLVHLAGPAVPSWLWSECQQSFFCGQHIPQGGQLEGQDGELILGHVWPGLFSSHQSLLYLLSEANDGPM